MKILVTGMTSRQCSEKASKRDVTFAWLLKQALEEMGHVVELRDPNVEEDLSDYDHAFVGLGPLHGMGTNRSYGALAVCLRMWDGKLTIFLDDEDQGKVLGGLRTVLNDPGKRFCKEFFAYKRDWEVAKEEPYYSWLLSGVKMLSENAWPRLIVPAFAWADRAKLVRIPNAAHNTIGIDLSAYLPQFETHTDGVARTWVYEGNGKSKWFQQQRTTIPILYVGKEDENDPYRIKRPHDDKLVNLYRNYWGVLNEPSEGGVGWTSRMGYAVQAETLYITRWQDVEPLGQAYALLPDTAEQMDWALRQQWVDAQRIAYNAFISTKEQVKQALSEILEPATKEEVAS